MRHCPITPLVCKPALNDVERRCAVMRAPYLASARVRASMKSGELFCRMLRFCDPRTLKRRSSSTSWLFKARSLHISSYSKLTASKRIQPSLNIPTSGKITCADMITPRYRLQRQDCVINALWLVV